MGRFLRGETIIRVLRAQRERASVAVAMRVAVLAAVLLEADASTTSAATGQ